MSAAEHAQPEGATVYDITTGRPADTVILRREQHTPVVIEQAPHGRRPGVLATTGLGAATIMRGAAHYLLAGEYGAMIREARLEARQYPRGSNERREALAMVAALRDERATVVRTRLGEGRTKAVAASAAAYPVAVTVLVQLGDTLLLAPAAAVPALAAWLIGRRERKQQQLDAARIIPGEIVQQAAAVEEGPLTDERLIEAIRAAGIFPKDQHARQVGLRHSYPATATTPAATEAVFDVPPGIEARLLSKKRGVIASALGCGAGQIDLEFYEKNARRFSIHISDDLPFTSDQVTPGPLLELAHHGGQVDFFAPIPAGRTVRGAVQYLPPLVEKSMLIGGEPGAGKSVAAFCVLLAAALDPRVRLWLVDGKGVGGNLKKLKPIADRYDDSLDPREFMRILDDLRAEMQARVRLLNRLGEEKITAKLVKDHPELAPLVFFIDELKEYTAAFDPKLAKEFNQKLISLVSLARATGIITIACTQKPSTDVVKSSLRDLLVVRWALRCATSEASDTILPGKSAQGYGAETISIAQRGAGLMDPTGTRPVFIRSDFYGSAHIAAIVEHATRLRERAGTLPEPAASPGVLADLLDIFAAADNPKGLSTADLLDALAERQPDVWSPEVLGVDTASEDGPAAYVSAGGTALRKAIAEALKGTGRALEPGKLSASVRGYRLDEVRAAAGIDPV